MSDGLREYIDLVTGITEATATRAKAVAAELMNSGIEWGTKGHTTVSDLADELVTTGRDNREALIALIRTEVDRSAARMGLVTEDEVAALRQQVTELKAQLAKEQRKNKKSSGSKQKATSKQKISANKKAVNKKAVKKQKGDA